MKTNEEMPEHLKAVYGEFRSRLYVLGLAAFIVATVLAHYMSRLDQVLR